MSGEFDGKVVVSQVPAAASAAPRRSAFARRGAHVVAANRRAADGESLVAEIAALGGQAPASSPPTSRSRRRSAA